MSRASMRRHLAVIVAVTTTQDTIGGRTETPTVKHAAVPCHLYPIGGRERPIVGKDGVESTHRMECSATYDIVEPDLVRRDAEEYEIVWVNTLTGRRDSQVVDLVRRT